MIHAGSLRQSQCSLRSPLPLAELVRRVQQQVKNRVTAHAKSLVRLFFLNQVADELVQVFKVEFDGLSLRPIVNFPLHLTVIPVIKVTTSMPVVLDGRDLLAINIEGRRKNTVSLPTYRRGLLSF